MMLDCKQHQQHQHQQLLLQAYCADGADMHVMLRWQDQQQQPQERHLESVLHGCSKGG